MNILVATPGRILHHMNETPYFDAQNLQMLVIDEVDRILDIGFSEEISQIMRNLPEHKKYQTLMFSATADSKTLGLAKSYLKKDFSFFNMHQ